MPGVTPVVPGMGGTGGCARGTGVEETAALSQQERSVNLITVRACVPVLLSNLP